MNNITKKIMDLLKDDYNIDIEDVIIETDDDLDVDYVIINDKIYTVDKSIDNSEYVASYIANNISNVSEMESYAEKVSDSWLNDSYNNDSEDIEEDFDITNDSDSDSDDLEEKYTTSQAKILDELSYLISTEYEAIKWYDEAIPMIQSSGMDDDLIVSTILGIEEIRKDEEDHVAHLERLVKQIKKNSLIEGTNGDE